MYLQRKKQFINRFFSLVTYQSIKCIRRALRTGLRSGWTKLSRNRIDDGHGSFFLRWLDENEAREQKFRRVFKLMLARWRSQPIKYRFLERQPITERLESISLKSRLSEIRLKIRLITVEYSENGGVNDCKEYFADDVVIKMTHWYESQLWIIFIYESIVFFDVS